ncbi:hypothetical protein V5F89_12395 [Pelagerythrobacter marensis]|uniref:Uncharacterized protein n=1 Tax=Pelagerythrobacter marensis TaxID=543877 RepID=A0ABZ2D2D6_9SPHN
MKLSMLPIVRRTAEALGRIDADIGIVESDLFDITFAGRYQDDALKAAAKAAILAELRGRKASLERDLQNYGVEVCDG